MKLTQRESEVLQHLLLGKTNKQIALYLRISDYTVRDHVSSLLRKSGATSRTELIAKNLNTEPPPTLVGFPHTSQKSTIPSSKFINPQKRTASKPPSRQIQRKGEPL
jgi:DNA-binding CsgD family transcriptional regulator